MIMFTELVHVLDYMIVGLNERFVTNEDLLKDCAALDPKRFSELKVINLDRMKTVAKLAKLDFFALRSKLRSFLEVYSNLINTDTEPEQENNDLDDDCLLQNLHGTQDYEDEHDVGEIDDDNNDDNDTIVKCNA